MRAFAYSLLNTLFLSLSFFTIFCAYYPTEGFMTRLFGTAGFWALGIVYFAEGFFSNFAGAFIQRFGPRVSMVVGAVPYFLFIGSLLLERAWLLYLMSVLVGIGAAVLWAAQGVFLARIDHASLLPGPFHPFVKVKATPAHTCPGAKERRASAPEEPRVARSPLVELSSAQMLTIPLVTSPSPTETQSPPPSSSPLPPTQTPPSTLPTAFPNRENRLPPVPPPSLPMIFGAGRRQPPVPPPPLPLGPAKTNMGLLSGLVYFADGLSSIVGFLISDFLVESNLMVLLAVLTGIAFLGMVSLCFMRYFPPVKRDPPADQPKRNPCMAFANVFKPVGKLMINPDMLLFQVAFLFYGCFYSFMAGSATPLIQTDAFVAPCMITRGVAAMVAPVLLGKLGDKIGRIGTLIGTYVLAFLALAFVLMGVLVADWLFFLAYVFFGCVETSQPTLIYALLEQLFQGKAEAYACWGILRSLVCGAFFIMGDFVSPLALGVVVAVLGLLAVCALIAMWVRSWRARLARKARQRCEIEMGLVPTA
ncbi:hypothetical protein PAPYR_120 [Paratrimastix pyriformis]|uniref:UNC93-like protein MFSD11 n=1 Tax=Paratrimastix pyriformis TaxID=342808 RepID=A0ABQ8UWR2_9EUKA|nr:hypothetical protein PAPYR_120 [Paratrimastix pyriformis]